MADQGYSPQQGYPPVQDYPPPHQGYPPHPGHMSPEQGYPPQHVYPPQSGYSSQQVPQTTMVIREPHTPANDYLIPAILVTIFCCWPLGIVAIIKALDVRRMNDGGDYEAAQLASQEAKKWTLGTLICGIVTEVIATIVVIVWIVAATLVTAGTVNDILDNYDYSFFGK